MGKVGASGADMEMKALIMDEYIIRSRLRICSACCALRSSDTGGHRRPL